MSNFETIKAAYAAFARNDPSVLFGAMDPTIRWSQAEGNPLADRNPYGGPQAIGEGVFGRLLAAIDNFTVAPDAYIDGGDHVVVLGRYSGVIAILPRLSLCRRQDRDFPTIHRHGAVGPVDGVSAGPFRRDGCLESAILGPNRRRLRTSAKHCKSDAVARNCKY